jgi:hypothetical protein
MPLPSGTISLSNIANISGAYNMNDDSARKLCGVSRSSGTSWSMSDAQGKAWVTSATSAGYLGGNITENYPEWVLTGGGGVYTARVVMQERAQTIATFFFVGYAFAYLVDTGGGFTSQPSVTFTSLYSSGMPANSATVYGILSGTG